MADNIATEIAAAPSPPALSATSDMPVATPVPEPPASPPPAEGGDTPPASPSPPAEGEEGGEGGEGAEGGEGSATPPATATPPRDRSFGGRLSELTQARRAAEARADKLADLVEKLVERVPGAPQPAQPGATETPPAAPDPRPQRTAFDDPDA